MSGLDCSPRETHRRAAVAQGITISQAVARHMGWPERAQPPAIRRGGVWHMQLPGGRLAPVPEVLAGRVVPDEGQAVAA